jgi:predicted phage terminase large subunit-like protein
MAVSPAEAQRQSIRPQAGPQEAFLSSPADIVIYGGSAGGGKTYGLLLEPLRHVSNDEFGAVIFRREAVQITNEGGLWDTAMGLYPQIGGRPRQSPKLMFTWPEGGKISFAHLQTEASVLDWQGAQIPLLMFDELTHFTRAQFFYMLSRNRSTCGIRPYVRATCNPDADSWVADLIAWWIDQDTGYPIQARSGVVRWFARVNDVLLWGDSAEELSTAHGIAVEDCKSLTFIAASIHDNQALLKKDPGYLANLKALARVERERLLSGNWKIRPAAGLYFKRHEAKVLEVCPTDVVAWARAWDFAATEPTEGNENPDWTAGIKIGRRASGRYVVSDGVHERRQAAAVRALVKRVAEHDGKGVCISIPEDPGQAGKDQASSYVTMLAGWPVTRRRPSKDKITRAEPVAAQWQAGNVDVVRGPWNDSFFAELEAFPGTGHDDYVDALADGFATVIGQVEVPAGLKVAGL